MQRNSFTGARKLTLAAMFAAFTLLFLYLGSILPTGRLAMYFLSSIFIAGLLTEHETGIAFLMFIVVSLLSLLILPDKTRALYYVLFFGHYGIGKYFIEKIKDKVTAFILKLLYFNAAMAVMYFLAKSILLPDVSLEPIWVPIVIAQPLFILYDYLYSLVSQFYYQKIRKWLMRPTRQ